MKIDDQRSCKTRLEQLVHDTISNRDGDVNRGHKLTYLIIMDFVVKVFDKVPHRMLPCKVRKRANIRNRYNQVPHLTQDTNGKVTNSQLDIKEESQEASPFSAGAHRASINRRARKHNKQKTGAAVV